MLIAAYIPQDRRQALARGVELPDRSHGAAVLADISGFTPLAQAYAQTLGPRRGAEELARQLNQVYNALIAEVDGAGGSVIYFNGDGIICWFDDRSWEIDAATQSPTSYFPAPARAAACACALQRAMKALATLSASHGGAGMALKVAVASGWARRFLVGDRAVQQIEVLAGAAVERLAIAESLAYPGDVVIDEATAAALDAAARIAEWRTHRPTGQRYGVLTGLAFPRDTMAHKLESLARLLALNTQFDTLRPWLLWPVYERLRAGLGEFLTELRPVVALFLRFDGIDYDADDARMQLDDYIGWAQRVLARYDGTLLQLSIGDKGSYLYVVFGAPCAHEDDPRRAAKAALELRAAPADLKIDPPKIGISQGLMRVGAYGSPTRRTYGVQGTEANLAARLMQHAGPGEVLISGRIQAALGTPSRDELFTVEPLEPIPLKGMPEPLPVFRLTGLQRQDMRLSEPAYVLPMVGRKREQALIEQKLDLALAGRGQVVGLVAEAGMGKSRLVAELIRLAHRKGLRGFGGACQSYGTNTPYLVWENVWRAFFKIGSDMPANQQTRALEGLILDWAPERVELLPLLGPLLAIDLPENDFTRNLEPQYRKSAVEALLLECLMAAAHKAAMDGSGLLFVLEDLHWIDAASHDLLQQIAQTIVDLPVLIVLAYRPPEMLRLQAPRIEALAHFTRVELGPLTDAEAAQAIRAKLVQLLPEHKGAATPALIARITERAQGNPFYVEELLNYLGDRGIDPHDIAALERLDLPASLHTLILSRIDRLSDRERAAIKLASVIGRLFRFAWLHGAYPVLGDTALLRADLDALAKLDLTPLDTPEPELTYLFKHIVTQEVAYESLTVAARASLHEQLAAYLEWLAVDETEHLLDLLAYHYGRSDNLAKKREYLRRAGDAAAARYANDAAINYLSRALELTPAHEPAERYALLLERVKIYDLQGDRLAQEQGITALEQLADALGDDRRRAEAAARRANYADLIGDYAAAIVAAERAVRLAEAAGAANIAAEACCWSAWALIAQGRYRAAHAQAHSGLELARTVGDRQAEGQVLNALAAIAFYEREFAAAHDYSEQYLEIARESGRRDYEAGALANLGEIAMQQNDNTAAWSYTEQSLRIAHKIGNRPGEGQALGRLGDIARMVGDYGAAQAYLEQALGLFRAAGMRPGEGWYLGYLGLVAHHQGDDASAEQFSRQAAGIGRAIGERLLEAFAQTNLGHALLGLGRQNDAMAAYAATLDLRRDLQQPQEATEALAGLARVALAQGDIAEARRHVEAILSHLGRGGTFEGTYEPLRIYLTCYRVLQAAGDPRAAAILELTHTTLREQAATIPDQIMRCSFLEKVPYHREIVAAWAADRQAS